jgi:hypothetical protein
MPRSVADLPPDRQASCMTSYDDFFAGSATIAGALVGLQPGGGLQ